jgi:holo-[acyl-carrier protein] synthase
MAPTAPDLGQDLVDVGRFRRALAGKEAQFARRVFTAAEWAQAASGDDLARELAVRFAAKEAAFKALGTGWGQGLGWKDIEVVGGADEAPSIALHGKAAKLARSKGVFLTLSMSSTDALAVAMVLAQGA